MASFVKLPGFVENLAEGVHNLGSDQLALAYSNTAPGSESTPPNGSTAACILANVTQISYTNASSRNVTTTSSSQTGGVYTLVLVDHVLTASGTVGPYRYRYLYNNTAASKNLIGYWDYGSSITLASGETDTTDFSANTIQIT